MISAEWLSSVPDHWTRGRLKDLISSSANGTWGSDPIEEGNNVRCIRAADFDRVGRRADLSNAPLRYVEPSSLHQHLLRPGDLILEKSGGGEKQPVGMAVLFTGIDTAVCSNFCARIRPSTDVDSRFLTYVFAAAYGQGLTQAAIKQTTGIQNLDTGSFFASRWAFPVLDEQRRIADFLDAETALIDNLSVKRRRMRELLALKRERVIESLLGLERGNSPHALVPLKYMVEAVSVGIVITPAKWYVDAGGTPALRGLNVRPGAINSVDLVRISAEGHAEHVKSRLQAGDVVVVRTGQAGAAAVVPPEFDGANCIDLIIIRPGRKISPKYLEYVLNSEHARSQVSEHAVGSIQTHFNVGAMKQIPLPDLSHDDQEETVARLDQAIDKIDHLRDKLVRQERLLVERRQALITAAVTGQFDVSTASDRSVTEGVAV
ncbi:restriction endonuclease subunit S [Streptomyces sp. NPDC090057]|uniref:restriction endonuclease subunit S n=1 Tax=Streptomyces sp. NPDC090057 TaxID=3365935 RepID=UPI003823FFE8